MFSLAWYNLENGNMRLENIYAMDLKKAYDTFAGKISDMGTKIKTGKQPAMECFLFGNNKLLLATVEGSDDKEKDIVNAVIGQTFNWRRIKWEKQIEGNKMIIQNREDPADSTESEFDYTKYME